MELKDYVKDYVNADENNSETSEECRNYRQFLAEKAIERSKSVLQMNGAKTELHDAVNHPDHYNKGGIECIDGIRAAMSKEAFCGFCKGNVLKYLWRYEDKKGVEDLRKARNYLVWLIEELEKE